MTKVPAVITSARRKSSKKNFTLAGDGGQEVGNLLGKDEAINTRVSPILSILQLLMPKKALNFGLIEF